MSDAAIKAALAAAAESICCHGHGCEHNRGIMDGPCCKSWQVQRAALCVAAFLRALPDEITLQPDALSRHYAGMAGFTRLALAVTRAANGARCRHD